MAEGYIMDTRVLYVSHVPRQTSLDRPLRVSMAEGYIMDTRVLYVFHVPRQTRRALTGLNYQGSLGE